MPASQPQQSYFYKLIVQHPGGEPDKEYFGTQLHTDCGYDTTATNQRSTSNTPHGHVMQSCVAR